MRDGQTKNSIVSESIDSSGMMMRKQREITKKASERTRSQNPTQKKTVQSADSKSIHARKLKEQQAQEQAKLEAIEQKIEKARKRIEEAKAQKSIKAQQTIMQKNEKEPDINSDLMFEEPLIRAKPHVPLIGGRQKS